MNVSWIIADLDWLVVVVLTSVMVASARQTSSNLLVALALDATPLLTLLNVCCLVIGVVGADWPLVAASTALATYQLATLERSANHSGPVVRTDRWPELALVCSNVYTRNRTPDALATRLLRSNPDLIVITEWNPVFADAFRRAGGDRYPHRVVDPSDTGDYAVCIVSRLPLAPESRMISIGPLVAARAVVRLRGNDVRILGVNPAAIVDRGGYRMWKTQMQALSTYLPSLVGPSVLIGDLNTTRHRPEFRALLNAGFADALEPAGTHRTSSFKIGARGPLGRTHSLVRLDHALINAGLATIDSHNLRGDGTDHSPFSLKLRLAPTPAAHGSTELEAAA